MARQGAGLGLSISKAYVDLLGGSMRVVSREGKGSVFSFTVPYTPAGGNAGDQGDRMKVSSAGQVPSLKILLAEDDDSSRKLVAIYAARFCSELLLAGTGREAVELCRANPDTDLVLMDIRMPGMNGYDATRQIREFNDKVIIIAQTAFALTGDRERSLEAGCNDYLVKPYRKEQLISMLEKYFGRQD